MSLAFFEHPLWSRLAAMHGHFLWQGVLIVWLYWTVVKLFAIESARWRYLLGMSGLAAMMVCPLATFFVAEIPQRQRSNEIADHFEESHLSLRERASSDAGNQITRPFAERKATFGVRQGSSTSEIPITNHAPTSAESQSLLIPILLGGWFLGVLIFATRLLAGVGAVVWWRWSSVPITDPRWVRVLERFSQELGLKRCPRLAVSLTASDAFSLGLIRPLIIFPAAWLIKLPPETLESVLAHELTHIRRWDAWANLFQRVLEAWLFYHPAVWWLSRQVEQEREKCCDLWAVSLTGDRLLYVKTLAGIAEFQRENRPAMLKSPILATGMGGRNMVLLERVRHILGETPRTGAASRFLAGAMVLAIPVALWAGTMMLPASAEEGDTLIAQAEGDKDGKSRRDGDAPKEGPRDGERERPEGRRDGDRPEREREREGDRPDREREGDRPDREREREGDRPDREREGDRPDRERPEGRRGMPGFPPRFGSPFSPRFGDGERPRDGEGPRGIRRGEFGPQPEMMLLIRELRREVEQLRQEVRELKEARGDAPREGDRPRFREGERRRDGEGFRGFRRPDREREGDAAGRKREGDRPNQNREREGDAAERESEEGRERLKEAREERDDNRDRPEREDDDA